MENIIFDSTKNLQISLKESATTPCDITVSYVDVNGSGIVVGDGAQESRISGTSYQTILSAPTSPNVRNALTVTVVNNDTVQHTFYIYKVLISGPTYYLVTEQVIGAGASWDSNLSNNLFDMAGTINNAGVNTTPNSASKIGFWDWASNSLRQMTFSQLVTWLGPYFGAPSSTPGHIAGFLDAFGKNLVDLGSPLTVLNSAVTPGTIGNVLTSTGSSWTSAAPSGGGGGVGTGWTPGLGTWTYLSADAPTFVISTSVDNSAAIGVGDRIQLTQTTVEYFIVTAITSSTITVYGGTSYVLANAAISSPAYSHIKNPLGFPASPTNWTVEFTDTISRKQNTPAQNIWYNLGGAEQITIPIGLWRVYYEVFMDSYYASGLTNVFCTLSTANNSESDVSMSCLAFGWVWSGGVVFREKIISLASKATYYLNIKTNLPAMAFIETQNSYSTMVIRAVCAYL